ncbi:integrase [Inhella inkyongensis]|uniref:Integrase n=1 Tax=Inhella inkyongensis TaxID=392593 RepID=A0A840S0C7_9BURK|nr:site-specific integrase [Inhella inkyongensis]MBB5202828.1 integrase [Inhella inkyongensis]
MTTTTEESTTRRPTRFNFTMRALAALPAHDANAAGKATEYSDTGVVGLKLAVGRGGLKTFWFRYLAHGRRRAARIGQFPGIDLAQARQTAQEMRAIVDRGGDPLNERDRRKAMPTFEEFVRDEYLPFAKQMGKKSVADDEAKLRMYLVPKLGKLRLSDIKKRDIQEHHAAMTQTHARATANRHLALLSAIFRRAVEWERVDTNPCQGVAQHKETNGRETFLSPEQCAALFAAMADDPNQTAVAALKLLLMTGARRDEALKARWEQVDLQRGTWLIPTTKSGRARTVVLSRQAIELLQAQPSRGTEGWVFPGRDPSKPLHDPRKTFLRCLAKANIKGAVQVRIHDLRHTAASLMVSQGISLFLVQKMLGHSAPTMTQRYSHLADDPLRAAAQSVGDAIEAAIAPAAQAA